MLEKSPDSGLCRIGVAIDAQLLEKFDRRIKRRGYTILLVEQNVEQALPLADHLYLLNLGQVKSQGPGREFDNARVRKLVQECLLG